MTEQADNTLVEIVRDGEHARLDLPEESCHVLVVKGQRAAEERVEDNSAGPDVHLGARVQLAGDDLRRRVVRGPAARPQELPVSHHVGEAEVSDLHIERLVQQQVLRLEVPVHHVVAVAVVHAADDLLEEPPGVLLLQLAVLHDVVEQLPAGDVLHHHEYVGGGADHLVQLDDVRVPEKFQILNFPPNFPHDIQVLYLLSACNFS